MGEVRVTVFRRPEDVGIEVDFPEFGNVVDDDEVGVEVYNAGDGGGEEVGEVDAGVVEWLVEGATDGGGDEVVDGGGIEGVEVEAKVREGGGDGFPKVWVVVGVGEEVEDGVFWTGGMLEDGEDGGDGAAEVGGGVVECHGDVDVGGVVIGRCAGIAVAECGCFMELRVVRGGLRGNEQKEDGGDGGG